jgi:uncharacterized protein YhfF
VDEAERLPKAEFAFPGPLRDRLLGAILVGEKTATASLRIEYVPSTAEPLPHPGRRAVVVDSDGRPVAVIETTVVDVVRFGDVGSEFARAEGEGFTSVDDWRRGHTRFWESDELRAAIGRPDFNVTDDTLVVAERFRLVEILD